MTRIVGLAWRREPISLPAFYVRWRRGDRSPELYVSTRHIRLWVALHESQVELQWVWFATRRKGEAPFSPATRRPGLRWVREKFYEFRHDGASPGDGEWFEGEA